MSLPSDAKERKAIPIATGFVDYFPLAMAAVAELSRIGNDQHNPGQPLHWAKEKSTDHADCLMRHFIERGTRDFDGVLHDVKVAWRAMAALETLLEKQTLTDKIIARWSNEGNTPPNRDPGGVTMLPITK